MDDVWGNAWSTAGSNDDPEAKKSALSAPKWNAFERDADDDTIDVGASSWNAGPGLGWAGSGSSSNLWHAESSTLDAWDSKVDHHGQDAEDEEPTQSEDGEPEDSKDLAPRTILPTPPQSPLPLPSPPLPPSSPVEESPPSPAPIRTVPGSPDPFGSFESAEVVDSEFQPASSWAPRLPDLSAEATDEPWGGAWGRIDEDNADTRDDAAAKDEWELAQEAKRRQERKVPPDLLASLVAQWDEYAKENIPVNKVDDTGFQSWRKGLDNVEGLTELVESLIPAASFPPPAQLSKTAVSRALKESLRLTRSFALTRSSPMSHLYASKGSTDWERSVKAQKSSANDEWGWDLKHEPEEKPDPADSAKEKKGGGLLSFWSKRTSSAPVTPTVDSIASIQPKSPTVTAAVKPTSPLASARPSIDASPNRSLSTVVSPTSLTHTSSTTPAPAATTIESDTSEAVTAQPSAVSRFFNRFSRKPTTASTGLENEKRSSVALSADDLSILSDMVPSTSNSTASLHNTHDSTGSLEAMLNSPRPGKVSSGKLPPPLAPPPAAAPRITGPPSAKSTASDSSFDAKMADAQLLDILENMGQSGTSLGYAPVSLDLIDQPAEPSTPPSKLRSQVIPSAQATSPPPRQKPPPQRSSLLGKPNTVPQSTLPPPLPPPMAPRSSSPFSTILAPTTPPPPSPLRNSFNHQRYDNPLPPTPQRDIDDFSEFFSAAPSPSRPPPTSSSFTNLSFSPVPPQQPLASASTGTNNAVDFGEYGDFVSHSPQSPSPPKASQQAPRSATRKATMGLAEKAASMTGHLPALPPPLPPPLAPPPGMGRFATSSVQPDLLGDDSPLKTTRPASTTIPGLAPPPRPVSVSQPATASPLSTEPATPAGKSGLSAQDLSFFEGL